MSENNENIFYGKVMFYNQRKAYGFIEPQRNLGRNIFFHKNDSNLEPGRDFQVGDEVSFSLVKDSYGRIKAIDVYHFINTSETKEISDATKIETC
jgi:cold shock CspA family protein